MMKNPLKLRLFDWIILGVSIGILLALSLFLISQSGGTPQLEVETPQGKFLYPLEKDLDLDFEGPLGTTRLFVRQGRVNFVESPCTNKLCIHAGEIHEVGQWNGCLPNQIFARIAGTPLEGTLPDAVTY